MSRETPDARFAERLRAAHGPAAGCPPPELFLAAEWAALPEAERRRIEAHAAGCPACAAERELAREFDAAGAEPAGEDVTWVVGRLEALDLPYRPRDGREGAAREAAAPAPLRFPERRAQPRRAVPAWALALAAGLLLALGLGYELRLAAPPALRPPEEGDVVRGSEIAVLAPVGEVAAAPAELSWEEVPGARSYRVTLRAVDDAVLWQGTAPGGGIRLPREVAQRLQPGVVYWWSVEALDAAGSRIAGSEPVRFQVRPSPPPAP